MTTLDHGFTPEEFAHVASLLRSGHEAIVKAALSNNYNVILAALDALSSIPEQGVKPGTLELIEQMIAGTAPMSKWTASIDYSTYDGFEEYLKAQLREKLMLKATLDPNRKDGEKEENLATFVDAGAGALEGALATYRVVRQREAALAPSQPAAVGERHGIYIASKTKHAARWRALRDQGVPVISTWIDEAGEGESQDLRDLWRRCLAEPAGAAALIVYREPDEVLKGGWIELGAAASHDVPVFAVGIRDFTISNHEGIRHFDTFDAALEAALRSTP